MLGISIYPEKQSKKAILNYLEIAAKYNFKRVFSCLLSAQKNKEELIKDFSEINDFAHKLGMYVILDVNPRVFDKFNATYDNLEFFKNLKADGIRLDLGFDGKKEADMTYNLQNLFIEINISNDNKYFDNILSYQPNKTMLMASHNFYPQKYTGLSVSFFEQITKKFKNNNIKTAAFITSKNALFGPWELSHGLCTVEICRELPITTQAKYLYATKLIDDVIIGNSFATENELKALSKVDKNVLSFKLKTKSLLNNSELENKILFEEAHFRRGDTNDFCIRSTQSRVKYKNCDFKANITPKFFKKGDVVICNSNYKQYKGELQIILQDMENIELGKNLVGSIIEEEHFLLNYLPALGRFKFEK